MNKFGSTKPNFTARRSAKEGENIALIFFVCLLEGALGFSNWAHLIRSSIHRVYCIDTFVRRLNFLVIIDTLLT